MKIICKIILIYLVSINVVAREVGETEITTEDGIEVFQNEKFYLLKKNVNIQSDSFNLVADNVKINFDENLYDITKLEAEGNVKFNSKEFGLNGNGNILIFEVKIERLKIQGKESKLITNNVQMFSDGFIEVNNLTGDFLIKGLNSKLVNENILIKARAIDGTFTNDDDKKEISFLNVYDENISYIKNIDTEMYANKINFKKDTSIIELIDNVTIIRNDEKISGDYGSLDTSSNSYKIKSKNNSKVKVIIQNNEQ